MKKREGFVSNSSSSSFILKRGEGFNETRDVAAYMLDYIDWLTDKDKKKLLTVLDWVDENDNIFFRSTNYDTYIQALGELIVVETANNHSWGNKIWRNTISHIPEEYQSRIENYGDGIDIFKDEDYEVKFHSLEYDIHILRQRYDKIPYDETICKNKGHYIEKLNIDGKLICPICDNVEVYKRKKKIKKLLDK